MQLSMDKGSQLHRVDITLLDDEIRGGFEFDITCRNRTGGVLSSYGTHLGDGGAAEVLPQCLHLVGLSWLYLDAKSVTSDVKELVTETRRRLSKAL